MTFYQPLYVSGRRDKTRRYVNTITGEIISRRRYIILTEGVSPEEKHIQRVKTGKAKPGKTYQRYLERKAKKEKARKERLKKDRKVWGSDYPRIRLRVMATGGKLGVYQLQGTYRFRNLKHRYYKEEVGYSLTTKTMYPYGSPDYIIRRRQAIENAAAKLDGYDWVYAGIIEEDWILW